MADTRDQMLVDFQAITGIEDVDTCMAILTQQDWNLELAVNTIMHDEPVTEVDASPARFSDIDIGHSSSSLDQITPVVIDDDASASGPSSSHSFGNIRNPPRMINFNVEYRLHNIPIVLPDSETVGKIKEIIQSNLGIPVDKQQLKGLVKRHVDDSVVLQDLHLPKENVLYLLTPDICSPTDRSTSADNGQVSHRNDEYRLKIVYRNGSSYRVYNLNIKGSRTIKDVKQDVFSLTDVPVRHQEWKGWPPGISEDVCLYCAGISFPTHELEVEKKIPTAAEQPVPNNEANMDSESDEENMDIATDEDLFEIPASRRSAPLISPDVRTEAEALEQFTHEFSERYGEIHPVFYIGSLDDAIRDALQVKATDRKLLALYLHHDDSIQANVFCSQLLCSESVVNVLSANFLTWAWDLTHPENLTRFLTLATKHFGSIAASQIRSYKTEQLPALLIISRSKATNEVIDAIQGHVTLLELMTRLLHAVDVFTEQKDVDIAEERERMDRERIKAEQDMAYQESLETDRKKAEAARIEEERMRQEKEKEIELKKEEEKKRQRDEAVKEALKASVAKSVPEAPAEDASGAISRLRFRVPGGGVITRSFWAENTVQDVLNFLTAQGFHTEDYKVITTFPRRDITQLDSTQTLHTAKLFPQETLTLEEKS